MAPESKPCVFCEIVEGRLPARVIEEDDLSVCLLDIQPFAEGHCLVVSRRHVPWWHDLDEAETASLFGMARRVAQRLGRTYSPDFVCLYARGRRVPHTHLFLVPTAKGDLLDGFFNALERTQEGSPDLAALREPEALDRAAEKIRGDLPRD